MADETIHGTDATGTFAALLRAQSEAAGAVMRQLFPAQGAAAEGLAHWGESGQRLQALWSEFLQQQAGDMASRAAALANPDGWASLRDSWQAHLPPGAGERQQHLWGEIAALWHAALGQSVAGQPLPGLGAVGGGGASLPRSDSRFADESWRDNPLFALVHQTYLLLAEETETLAANTAGLEPARQAQLRFFVATMLDALSPANFPLTNPQAIARATATQGESLVKGLEHLLADLRRGQLTHADPTTFRIGETIAATPGKVVHETPLYQLIQYTPVTENVLATPLVIFPPWINRFYILDLNPAKSFVRWCTGQGISTFMVSWKSADESMADVTWDDYIAAQIDAVEAIRRRLGVAAVHAIGYCVAGSTLAATLAIMARRGDADTVASATFFTAQVDFEQAGDLKHFVDDAQIAMIEKLGQKGYLDGRIMAATFNLLRGRDLIWGPAIKHYLLGEDHPAFDMLHWNGDVTNLPAKWLAAYLRDLYRDNRLAVADSLSALGTPIDLTRIATPCYIQAGREDHIAPPESVWKLLHYLSGPATFVLAGSGHIAGVVNPPAAGKYQHWTNLDERGSLAGFIAGAEEHKGSWWPHWAEWLRAQNPVEVAAKGRRVPGGKGDKIIEDAPGRYVRLR